MGWDNSLVERREGDGEKDGSCQRGGKELPPPPATLTSRLAVSRVLLPPDLTSCRGGQTERGRRGLT